MKTNFQNLENDLHALGKALKSEQVSLSLTQRQAIRDQVFRSIGRWDMADVIETARPNWVANVLGSQLKTSLTVPSIILASVLVIATSVTTTAFAQSAKPGDSLFGLRKVFENVQLAFTTNPEAQMQLRLRIAGERLSELNYANPADPGTADKILNESKEAIKQATDAIKKVDNKDTATTYLDRLQDLLSAQNTILDKMPNKGATEELKKTVLAVRDELGVDKKTDKPVSDKTLALNDKSTKVEAPIIKETPAVLPSGQSNLTVSDTTLYGNLTMAYGSPALMVGQVYYLLQNAPVDVISFIGKTGITVRGSVVNGVMSVIEIVIDGRVYSNQPFSIDRGVNS